MAPTLTSNTFLLPLGPLAPHQSRLTNKNHRFTVLAKKDATFPAFRLRKSPATDSSSEETSSESKPYFFDFSGVKSLIPVVNIPSSGLAGSRRKDPGTVFVTGATGLAGVRIAQALVREGFSVRAGVPELGAAQELARLASKYKMISNEESKRINAVESSFENPEAIARAIGNASKVVVTIGPSENGTITEVSTSDALQVILAAELAGVSHVAIIYDSNTTSSSTNNVLDGIQSFFNNLFAKSQPLTITELLEKVIQVDVRYTLIKTSLTEDFSPESSYNVVVAAEGGSNGKEYKVGKLQIASLVAGIFSNTAIAENKVVEVYTDPSAPLRKIDQLFSVIPEDGRRSAYLEAKAKAQKLKEEVNKLSEQEAKATSLAEAQEKAEAAAGYSFGKTTFASLSSQFSNAFENYKPNAQIATVRGQAKAKALVGKKAIVTKTKNERGGDDESSKKQVRNVFGGLFKQETIYMDD